jgi:hypothetical protein
VLSDKADILGRCGAGIEGCVANYVQPSLHQMISNLNHHLTPSQQTCIGNGGSKVSRRGNLDEFSQDGINAQPEGKKWNLHLQILY